MRFKGYKLSFKINASHKTSEKAKPHSHTFEFTAYVSKTDDFVQFGEIETSVGAIFKQYENKYLNDIPPFITITPTIENIAREFFTDVSNSCEQSGYRLYQLDICESSNRVFSIKNHEMNESKKLAILQAINEMNFDEKDKINGETDDNAIPKVTANTQSERSKPADITPPPSALTVAKSAKGQLREIKKMSNKAFIICLVILVLGGFATMMCVKLSGFYPLGLDVHGHLFKTNIMYEGIKEGNLYPRFTEYWYNGLQPYRYWPPMPYYFMAALQFIASGDIMSAYLGFIWSSFVIGGLGWLMFARKLNRPVLGTFVALIWFFLPDNLRVFFGEGNVPRMFITMLLPMIFYCIWQFVAYKRKKMIFPIIALMVVAALGHLMISAMIGVGTFVFLLIYAIANREYKHSIYCILAMLFSFAVAGIWVYPSLVGGITSMDNESTTALMASLNAPLSMSINPFLRLDGKVTELYYGLSVFLLAVMGVVLSNRRAMPGFASLLIVIVGSTTAMVPILEKIPFSQLFWMRRFAPIGYALFIVGVLEWRRIKKPLLVVMCSLIVIDCAPSANLKAYDVKMNIPATNEKIEQSMNDYLLTQAKEITRQRVCIMDFSTLGPMPSYALSMLEPKVQYVYGWAWQGASTADNIVRLNEALQNYNYKFIFDRCIELGADSVIFAKEHVPEGQYEKLEQSAQRLGYKLAGESKYCFLYSLHASGEFGVSTTYGGLAVGTTSSIVPQLFPYFGTSDYDYIDDYTFEELSKYDKLYLSGFFYKSKENAESLVNQLAESGVEIFIDMSNIPSDPLTTRMTFMGVSAQPITFNSSYPSMFIDDVQINATSFVEEYSQWNTVYLNNLEQSLGYSWFENEKLDFIGKKGNENIMFIGFNLLYHSLTANDPQVYDFLNSILLFDKDALPSRELVDIEVSYGKNQIIITSPQDNVNTTIAYQDCFESDREIRNTNNLLVVDKGTTVIEIKYPYFAKSLAVTLVGIGVEALIVYLLFKKRKAMDYTLQPKS